MAAHQYNTSDAPFSNDAEDQHSNEAYDDQEEYTDARTLLSWHAPARPYKKRKKEFYLNVLLIMTFLEIIGFLFHQGPLMTVIASFTFLICVIYTVPPHLYFYKITTEGILLEDQFFLWDELYDFFFKHYHDQDILIVRTHDYILGELMLPLGDVHKQQIKSLLIRFLPYREYMKPSFMEKSGDWLSKNFPLERS